MGAETLLHSVVEVFAGSSFLVICMLGLLPIWLRGIAVLLLLSEYGSTSLSYGTRKVIAPENFSFVTYEAVIPGLSEETLANFSVSWDVVAGSGRNLPRRLVSVAFMTSLDYG